MKKHFDKLSKGFGTITQNCFRQLATQAMGPSLINFYVSKFVLAAVCGILWQTYLSVNYYSILPHDIRHILMKHYIGYMVNVFPYTACSDNSFKEGFVIF